MRLFVYPPTAVSVTVPPIAYTDGGINTPVTPDSPLPVIGEFGATQFVRDGVLEEVAEDTTTPANNRPFPTGLYFVKNGMMIPVTDSAVPSEVAAIPVTIKATDGTNITITAGDINIQTTSEGPTFDSQRIGDGTGVYLKINSNGSINIVSQEIVDELLTIQGKQDLQQQALEDLISNMEADSLILDDIKAAAESIAEDVSDAATETTLAEIKTELEKKADLTETQPVSVVALPLPDGASTHAEQLLEKAELVKINTAIGLPADAAVINPASSASEIALLKGILTGINALSGVGPLAPISSETFVVTSASAYEFLKPAGAKQMFISVNANDTNANPIRWRPSTETAPTSLVGAVLIPTSPALLLPAGSLKAIGVGGSSDVTVSWFG